VLVVLVVLQHRRNPLTENLSFIVLVIIWPEEVHQINSSIFSWLDMNSGFSQDGYACIAALRFIVDIRATFALFQPVRWITRSWRKTTHTTAKKIPLPSLARPCPLCQMPPGPPPCQLVQSSENLELGPAWVTQFVTTCSHCH